MPEARKQAKAGMAADQAAEPLLNGFADSM